jgi:hypothetical protein
MSEMMSEIGQQISVGAIYHMHYKDRHGQDCVEDVDLGTIADDRLTPKQIQHRLKIIYFKHPRFAKMQRELAKELAEQNSGG